MLLIKALHIISMVAWFAGLFYLPRLFVYHTEATDHISLQRFKVMEMRLYYAITWPAAIFTTVLGLSLLTFNPEYYLKAGWMHAKLALIVLLWVYHLSCGHYVKEFAGDKNKNSSRFYRIYNEAPTLLLIAIVMIVVVKPF
jgi:putative membrane protein